MNVEDNNKKAKIVEIGSEFWLNNTDRKDTDIKIPHWLVRLGKIVLTSSGRGAISLILEQIDVKIKKVLLPSYICDSVIIPFEDAGYELIYYNVDKYFKPIEIEIENIEIGVFLHMGYFGFKTNELLDNAIAELRTRSVVIIEDVTHTLFSNYERIEHSDFAIGSIRKWFGIPSGGFVATNKTDKIVHTGITNPPSEFIDLRASCLKKKFKYIIAGNEYLKDEYLAGFRKAEQMLEEDAGAYRIDKVSEMIIRDMNVQEMQEIRRTNYRFLSKNLTNCKRIEVIFEKLDDDVTPLFLPIYIIGGRDRLRNFLIKRDIYCPIHWPIPKKLEGHLDSETKRIYDSVLSIPCDQRYEIKDMNRVVSAIKEWHLNERDVIT